MWSFFYLFFPPDRPTHLHEREGDGKRNILWGWPLRPETRDMATHVSGRKWVQSTELDIVNGSFCNLYTLAVGLALHIFATQCWPVPNRTKQLSTVAILLYRFLSCWCLETFFETFFIWFVNNIAFMSSRGELKNTNTVQRTLINFVTEKLFQIVSFCNKYNVNTFLIFTVC